MVNVSVEDREGLPSVIQEKDTTTMVPQMVNVDKLVNYIRSLTAALLGAEEGDLDSSFGERYNVKELVSRVCSTYLSDPNPLVLFAMKDVRNDRIEEGKCFRTIHDSSANDNRRSDCI